MDQAVREMVAEEVRVELARRMLTVRDLASEIGLSEHKLYRMYRAQQDFTEDVLSKIRKHLDLPLEWPFRNQFVKEGRTAYNQPTGKIPQIGAGVEAPELEVPWEFVGHGWSGLVVSDMALMPQVQPGDVLVLAETSKPRIGYLHVIKMPDGKLLPRIIEHDKGEFSLLPLNPSLPAEPLEGELLGIVVGWIHEDPPGLDKRVNPAGLRWVR